MAIPHFLVEHDATLTWSVGNEADLSWADDAHKHIIAMSFTAPGDWAEVLLASHGETPAVYSRYGQRWTAVAGDTVAGGQAGVVCWEWHGLHPGIRLRRSGAGVTLREHIAYDERSLVGGPA